MNVPDPDTPIPAPSEEPSIGTLPFAIETSGITRRFGALVAVDEVALAIARGTVFGLLGPNGAGKTTLIRMLTTTLAPSAGTARVSGYDVLINPVEVRRRIGYVPQLLSADGGLTGYENLLLFAKLYGVARPERRARIDEMLAFMDLSAVGDTPVRHYSGGMIRRLEIAQSMLHRPDVLFLDEPTIGLDPVARLSVWRRLREVREHRGTTIFMTTHDMEEADVLCDDVAIMNHGRVVTHGPPAALKANVGAHATLEDVFVHYSGESLDQPEQYGIVRQTRRTARRLG
jgi:ABC-2 type transport system ATP-binding protein